MVELAVAVGLGLIVLALLAAASWLFGTFPDESDDDDPSHYD